MRSGFKHSSRGYSLTELLVVVALIGVLSLITVPAFINFKNQNTFRSDLRNFANDLRAARQYAITQTVDVRVELDPAPGNQLTSNQYRFYWSNDRGATWTALTVPGARGITPGTNGNIKDLAGPVWFKSETSLPDPDGNSKPDVVFHPNGSMDLVANAANAQIVMRCAWSKVTYDTYTIGLSASGQFTSVGSHS
ncbi:MAG TPA: GspH/FimT family pseudopilin [Thermoanaerobaculia bacterium]|nr:GspH/FimT family pseudopilin [Thermoanaerobaculia bacterium]